jgi:transcriptional regulator with XRE-family HTH domain
MRIEEIIGLRIREVRTAKGWTQADLGVRMMLGLEKPWTPQAVSLAEKGERDFRAVELLMLAALLGVSVEYFFLSPDLTNRSVDLPAAVLYEDGSGKRRLSGRKDGTPTAAVRALLAEEKGAETAGDVAEA